MFSTSSLNTRGRRQSSRVTVVAVLVLLCIAADYYAHFVLHTELVVTHIFYLPIVVAGFCWGKRGIWIAIFVGGWLLASHVLEPLDVSPMPELLRFGMLIVVSAVVGMLREQSVTAEEALVKYSERLEEMVEELRDAQEELVRKGRLATLGQLAGGVTHELRNPLAVISNAIYFLQMTVADADETTKEYVGIISSEVQNAGRIISDLLDFSRIRQVDREEISVSGLVNEVLERQPPPEEVKVMTELPSDLPLVFVDPRQIGQVLTNLVTNAYQAMSPPPRGGDHQRPSQEGPGLSLSYRHRCRHPPGEHEQALQAPLHHQGSRDRAGFGAIQELGGGQWGNH